MVKVIPVKSAMRGTCELASGTPVSSMRTRISAIGAEVTRVSGTRASIRAVMKAAAPEASMGSCSVSVSLGASLGL